MSSRKAIQARLASGGIRIKVPHQCISICLRCNTEIKIPDDRNAHDEHLIHPDDARKLAEKLLELADLYDVRVVLKS